MIIHEESADTAWWFKLVILGVIGVICYGIVSSLLNQESGASLRLLGGVFVLLLYYFLIPRKFQIYHDRLKIVLGSPFSVNIPLSTIKEVKLNPGIKALFYLRFRFLTSFKYVVEVVRNKGVNWVISPKNGEIFLKQLNQAIENEAGKK